MRCKSAPPSVEVSREERVARLTSFISSHASAGSDPSAGVCLIARSLDSPVAKAVASACSGDDREHPVRALLASVDSKMLGDSSLSWEVRVLRTPRLLEAHEQMSVGGACWHGDCLKRDPDKRDVFEQFHEADDEVVDWTRTSFERLWAQAEPVVVLARVMLDLGPVSEQIGILTDPSAPSEEQSETLRG